MKVINPSTGQVVREYDEHTDIEIQEKLSAAEAAFVDWRHTSFEHRAKALDAAANVLHQRQTEFAQLMTEEMGKPTIEAKAEIEKCAWVCEYFAENAERFLAHESLPIDKARSYVRFDPLGPVLAIMPWNFPFWQVFRFAANRSKYGLGASIWSADSGRAEQLAAEIDSGCVFVNEFVKSDPRVPFGGVKRSGYGRELSDFGIREFTNIKSVWVNESA